MYTPARVQDLRGFGNDVTRGASGIGTDGHDLVWVEASGRSSSNAFFTSSTIWTAPYTTDPSELRPRALGSEFPEFFGAGFAFQVGCGYAMHETVSLPNGTPAGVRLVRLSVGRSWKITEVINQGEAIQWQHPLAVTCDEVFISGQVRAEGANVMRIRIDSLGPGQPIDAGP